MRVSLIYIAITSGSSVVIVVEYIRGSHCDASDVMRVADALKSLLDVKFVDQNQFRLGPVGKNAIEHPFFEGGSGLLHVSNSQRIGCTCKKV